ncbi:hypothetical protein Goari_003627 [Gossypium aridum]|uniref:Uncharacterized protein n=1 Tax=Gossypium aridum TaxID=34290 RepID=A0A7J8YC15_GOSAI|nr:hypothetical protein [Gossypium aridum]
MLSSVCCMLTSFIRKK